MTGQGLLTQWRHDRLIRLTADGRQDAPGMRDLWRISRRRFKHRILEGAALHQPRFFCLNSGGCGSTYLICLLADNGWPGVYHEKVPDFNALGVEHWDGPLSQVRLASLLRYTRWDVFLEANNRLFSLARPLYRAFPGSRFVHLHRDGREAVCSALSRPDVAGYLRTNIRFQGTLAGPRQRSPLERFCHYWNNMNRRILDDLLQLFPLTGPWLNLPFADLVAGRLNELERFTGREISVRRRPVVNRGLIGQQGRYPGFADWPESDQRLFHSICGETMQRLGYSL